MKDYNFNLNVNNNPISVAANTTTMDETDKTPVILEPGMKSILEQQLGHPIKTMGDLAECWNKGIIQPLDPKIVRELMDASANWDYDGDEDDDWMM